MTALKKIGLATATAATAVGMIAGVAPASAAPTSTPGHNLYVFPHPADPSRYIVTVKGSAPTRPARRPRRRAPVPGPVRTS